MKKILILLIVILPIFTNCKNSEIDSNENFDLQYDHILNNEIILKEEKLNKLTELFAEKYNIKTALSVSVQNKNINFYKNYGLSSLSDKNVCNDETENYESETKAALQELIKDYNEIITKSFTNNLYSEKKLSGIGINIPYTEKLYSYYNRNSENYLDIYNSTCLSFIIKKLHNQRLKPTAVHFSSYFKQNFVHF